MLTLLSDRLLKFGTRPLIMGIINVTPDSFSDGGNYKTSAAIIRQVDQMVEDGADIIDVGGESTRPFAAPVSIQEETERVIPAIEIIRRYHTIPISIDSTKSEVARNAMEAGADILNDISALRLDPEMINVAKACKAPVIIMHMQGDPENMQVRPHYDDVVCEISAFFQERLSWLEQNGLPRKRIIIDPGIGFGKTVSHNLSILKHVEDFKALGCPVLIGHSRKSFIGKILELEVSDRDHATAVISSLCALKGAAILRVHDVKKTAQAIKLAEAILNAP